MHPLSLLSRTYNKGLSLSRKVILYLGITFSSRTLYSFAYRSLSRSGSLYLDLPISKQPSVGSLLPAPHLGHGVGWNKLGLFRLCCGLAGQGQVRGLSVWDGRVHNRDRSEDGETQTVALP